MLFSWTDGSQVLYYSMNCSIMVLGPVDQLTYEGRKCQKNYRLLKLRKEMNFAISGIYSAIKWQDKKYVALLSTIHRVRICDTGKIDRKTKEVVKKPDAVIEYSANMGGVDRLDQKIK